VNENFAERGLLGLDLDAITTRAEGFGQGFNRLERRISGDSRRRSVDAERSWHVLGCATDWCYACRSALWAETIIIFAVGMNRVRWRDVHRLVGTATGTGVVEFDVPGRLEVLLWRLSADGVADQDVGRPLFSGFQGGVPATRQQSG